MNHALRPNISAEPADPLAPEREAYWVQKEGTYRRIVVSAKETTEDVTLRWVAARVTQYAGVQRTLMQRLLRTELDGTMRHPSGREVQRVGPARDGFLLTALASTPVLEEAAQRTVSQSPRFTELSDRMAFMENAVPLRIHTGKHSTTPVQAIERSVEEIEHIYRRAFEGLSSQLLKHLDRLSAEDASTISMIDTFRRDRVKWATMDEKGRIFAREEGRVGDAWICVAPPTSPLMEKQQSILAASVLNGVYPYLSILPYDISETWASLGAIHELSHLRDSVLGIEPKTGATREQYLDGEHRAYSVERGLAFAYSGLRLQPTLETIVANAMKEQEPMRALNALMNEHLASMTESLDQCIEPSPPRSPGEQGIHQGLYMMLIGFKIARQIARGDDQRRVMMEKGFIEHVYQSTGHLPSV